jgi:NADPH:quinone reductase
MRAAWYERQGPASEVLVLGEMPTPVPASGEVRIRIAASGINPGDVKKRQDAFGYGMPYPRVIPHSDGAGTVDAVGAGVAAEWLGRRVWCYGAQTYRPHGTAAEYTVLPLQNVVVLPDQVSFEQGACLGIPAITAHRSLHIAGPLNNRTVLVQGGSGAVGLCAVRLARDAGAQVIASCRSAAGCDLAILAGAHAAVLADQDLVGRVREMQPAGVDHIVEVAFGENLQSDMAMLAVGGSIASYASGVEQPAIPFWPLLFANTRLFFVGSDDVPVEAKRAAAQAVNRALELGWDGMPIAHRVGLSDISAAHHLVEQPTRHGRVVLMLE